MKVADSVSLKCGDKNITDTEIMLEMLLQCQCLDEINCAVLSSQGGGHFLAIVMLWKRT